VGVGVTTEQLARIRAAGGVLWRPPATPAGGDVEVALVHRPRYDDWSLPKGKLHTGEHPLPAACREVLEETGIRPVAGPRLPSLRYPVPTARGVARKDVEFWAMVAAGAGRFEAGHEVDRLAWVPLPAASAALTDARGTEVLSAFAALPRISATVLLLRHGLAGRRGEWPGTDVTRPLDAEGERQSRRMAEVLACYAPDRIVTATPRRCVQTVEPLAAALRLELEADGVFDETAHERHPEAAAERIRALASRGGRAVVCSQGGVIPDTVALLADTDGPTVPDVKTPKGSAWVLSFAGPALVTVDRLGPDD
jgi:phosphohistidine phosphatase SixA/8-oxo-dGTP pyrophosphatase MutT (NUDIX family)